MRPLLVGSGSTEYLLFAPTYPQRVSDGLFTNKMLCLFHFCVNKILQDELPNLSLPTTLEKKGVHPFFITLRLREYLPGT